MDINAEVRSLAERSEEPIRRKLFEYLVLREQLIALTGQSDPFEAELIDIILIEDLRQQRLAGHVAARMRRLIRQTLPTVTG